MSAAFFGKWELIPELCQYWKDVSPDSCTYGILEQGDRIAISISWTTRNETHEISFSAASDGTIESASDEGPAHRLWVIDDHQLEGMAILENNTKSFASRRVSHDGQSMSIMQTSTTLDYPTNHIFQVYRRIT